MKLPASIAAVLVATLAVFSSESIAHSSYPNKTVKLVIGFAPGGSTDIVGRIMAQRLGERLGQTVIVENKVDVAILAGEVQAVFGSMPALLQNVKGNKVRPLAVGTEALSPALPNVPTVAEQGYPGFAAALWLGIMGPANMPKAVVDRLHKEITAIVATPEFKAAMDANGAEPIASKSPEEFREMLRGQVAKYVKITKALGINLD